MISALCYVAVGGFFGSILRYIISEKTGKHFIGTWIANITGSLLLAILFRLYYGDILSETLWLMFGTGFCGAYTTFSTFSKEVVDLLLERKFFVAFGYIGSSLVITILLVIIVFYFSF